MTRASLPLQETEQLASGSALEAAADLALALALGGASRHVAAGRLVVALADHDDGEQRPVELPVAAAVQPVADHLAGGGLDWAVPASMAKAASGCGSLRAPRGAQAGSAGSITDTNVHTTVK
jgi:hypothetical protein